jgi:hypothetical protein
MFFEILFQPTLGGELFGYIKTPPVGGVLFAK